MKTSTFSPTLLRRAAIDALRKFDPREQIKNPVMFVVFIGAIVTTVVTFRDRTLFNVQITLWLWFTVLFANFAEAVAEGRGKAQADSLRKARTRTEARRLDANGAEERVSATELRKGDRVVC